MAIHKAIQARLQPSAPDTITTVTIPWGRGVGKSKFTRLLWWTLIAEWDGKERPTVNGEVRRGIRIVHLMPTHKQCVDVHGKDTLEELYHSEWAALGGVVNKTRWEIKFPGGSWIQWFGTTDANNNRGLRCDVVTEDEVDDIEPSVDQAIVLPYLSEPWSLKVKLAAGTPRRGRNGLLWIGHEAALNGKPGFYSFHATYRDAPQQVSAAYVESVRAVTDPVVFAREWECNFDSAEGMVYSMFDRQFHVKEPPPNQRWSEMLVGIDHGWEDPGVLLLVGVIGNGRDATCWILDEVYEKHQVPTWWTQRAKKFAEQWNMATSWRQHERGAVPCRWFADPSRPEQIQEFVRAGIRVEPAKNAVEDGILAVADKLIPRLDPADQSGQRRVAKMYVHPRCKHTIEEFGKYRRRRDPKNPDRVLEQPEDKHNHCFVAGTLVMTDQGEVPIENVCAGMRVLTREGYYPVKAAGMTREDAEVWTLAMSDGRSITGTPDHLVWTEEKGWTRLDALRYGDTLCAWESTDHPSATSTAARSVVLGSAAARSVAASPARAAVYDLTVDGPPEFFAGGILVHNCLDGLKYLTLSRFGGPSRERHESGPGWGTPQAA